VFLCFFHPQVLGWYRVAHNQKSTEFFVV